MVCRNFKDAYLRNSLQLAFTGCQDSLIKSTQQATLLLKVAVVNENIVKSKVRFKINQASMNDYNYGKLRLSFKAVSL